MHMLWKGPIKVKTILWSRHGIWIHIVEEFMINMSNRLRYERGEFVTKKGETSTDKWSKEYMMKYAVLNWQNKILPKLQYSIIRMTPYVCKTPSRILDFHLERQTFWMSQLNLLMYFSSELIIWFHDCLIDAHMPPFLLLIQVFKCMWCTWGVCTACDVWLPNMCYVWCMRPILLIWDTMHAI